MIDLHYAPTPNGWKISIMLEELGLPYTVIPVNIRAGDQFKPEFLAISPNNRIPAIVDRAPADGGEPFSVFETGAILILCVLKIRFCNIDGEGRQGQVVRRRRRGAQSRDGEGRPCSEIDGSSTHYNRRHIRVGSGAGALRQTRSCGRDIRGSSRCAQLSRDLRSANRADWSVRARSGSDQPKAEWQAAMRALLLVAEHDDPAMFARIDVIRALNSHFERVFDPSRNENHSEPRNRNAMADSARIKYK